MKRPRIDKSVLTHGVPYKVEDRQYLDSFKGRACESCGRVDGTVVAAHISWDSHVSHSQKADDRRTVALCFACHQQQESRPGPEWWMRMVYFRE